MENGVDTDNLETLPFQATQVADVFLEPVLSPDPNLPPSELGGGETGGVEQPYGQRPMPTYEDPLCRNYKCLEVVAVGENDNFDSVIPESAESPAIPKSNIPEPVEIVESPAIPKPEAVAPEIRIPASPAPPPSPQTKAGEFQTEKVVSPTRDEILEGEAF